MGLVLCRSPYLVSRTTYMNRNNPLIIKFQWGVNQQQPPKNGELSYKIRCQSYYRRINPPSRIHPPVFFGKPVNRKELGYTGHAQALVNWKSTSAQNPKPQFHKQTDHSNWFLHCLTARCCTDGNVSVAHVFCEVLAGQDVANHVVLETCLHARGPQWWVPKCEFYMHSLRC